MLWQQTWTKTQLTALEIRLLRRSGRVTWVQRNRYNRKLSTTLDGSATWRKALSNTERKATNALLGSTSRTVHAGAHSLIVNGPQDCPATTPLRGCATRSKDLKRFPTSQTDICHRTDKAPPFIRLCAQRQIIITKLAADTRDLLQAGFETISTAKTARPKRRPPERDSQNIRCMRPVSTFGRDIGAMLLRGMSTQYIPEVPTGKGSLS